MLFVGYAESPWITRLRTVRRCWTHARWFLLGCAIGLLIDGAIRMVLP